MKFFALSSLLMTCSALAQEPPAIPLAKKTLYSAQNVQRDQDDKSIVRLSGNVIIITSSVTIHADQAVSNTQTGEIELQGNVRVKLAQPQPK